MKIARTSTLKKKIFANDDFITFYDVHVKNMLRTRSFNLFVNRQIRNHLRQLCLIRVVWTIEQRQWNDDTIYEDTKIASRIIFEDFRVISLKILKEETHVQFIHLHLFDLQITIRNRLNKHEHRTLINDFCNRIKNLFVDARERRRRHDILTSEKRKQRWYKKFQKKLLLKNKAKNTQRAKVYKKIFNNK
jgi:hypothetical protein